MAVLSSSTTHFFPRTISITDALSLCNTNSRGQQGSKVQLFCLSIVMKISTALQALDRSLRYFQVGSYKCLPHNNLPFPQEKNKNKKKRKTEPEGEVHNSKETQAWFYMKCWLEKKKKKMKVMLYDPWLVSTIASFPRQHFERRSWLVSLNQFGIAVVTLK